MEDLKGNSGSVPAEYTGREQTWVKHCILKSYLISWANKIASTGRAGKVRLWYVDTFAGPWQAKGADLQDTSIVIGLNAIQEAGQYWQSRNIPVEIGAIFIEKDPKAFKALEAFIKSRKLQFDVYPLSGSFAQNVDRVEEIIKDDPAFCFVDPTGWKGADMKLIKRLVSKPRRDVMINFMYDYVNRFIDHREGSQHDEMTSFFGAEIPADLAEEDLMQFYRQQLKATCALKYTADLVVQDPCKERTKFRLVVGGNHVEVLVLFRDIEKRIAHFEQPIARLAAKEKRSFEKTGQLSLLSPIQEFSKEDHERDLVRIGQEQVIQILPSLCDEVSKRTFGQIYPEVLQNCRITLTDLKKLIWSLKKQGKVSILNLQPNQKTVWDENIVSVTSEDLSLSEEILQTSFKFD